MLHICPCMKASNAYTHVFLIFIHLQNALCLFIYFWPYLRQPFNYWDFKWLTPCGKPSVFALITWPYYGWLEKCFQVYHTQCTLHLAQYCQGDFHHHRKDPAIIPPLLFPVQLTQVFSCCWGFQCTPFLQNIPEGYFDQSYFCILSGNFVLNFAAWGCKCHI